MTKRIKRNPTRFNPKVAKNGVSTQTESNTAELEELVVRFNTAWRQSVESIIESGQVLIEAKVALKKAKGHGNWMLFLEKIKLNDRTANYLMKIAENPVLTNSKHASNLPRSWFTLAKMTDLENSQLETLLDEGKINAETERKEVEVLIARNQKRGHYNYEHLVGALATVNKFMQKWPDLNPALIDQLADSLITVQDIDDAASMGDVPKLSEWLTKLHGACDAKEQEWLAELDDDADAAQEPVVIKKKGRRRNVPHDAEATL
jgi:hypothetical protein